MSTFSITSSLFFSCRNGLSLLCTYTGLLLLLIVPVVRLPLSTPAEQSLPEPALHWGLPGPCDADPLQHSGPKAAPTKASAAEDALLPYPRLWTVWQLWQ